MSLHGVFHKSRVFDPTCLYEAKVKPMIQQKGSFCSYLLAVCGGVKDVAAQEGVGVHAFLA